MKHLKRFLLIFSLVSVIFATNVWADTSYAYDEDKVKDMVEQNISVLLTLDETGLEHYANNSYGWISKAADTLLTYKENDTLGKYVASGEYAIEENEQKLIVSRVDEYENNNLKITVIVANVSGTLYVTDVQFGTAENSDKSLGEKMLNALSNTVIGVVSVFAVLILISFIISLFKYIPKIQAAFSRRKSGSAEAAFEKAIAQIEKNEEVAVNDTELVAVITAAICAATGASSDSFVVRSIKKTKRIAR